MCAPAALAQLRSLENAETSEQPFWINRRTFRSDGTSHITDPARSSICEWLSFYIYGTPVKGPCCVRQVSRSADDSRLDVPKCATARALIKPSDAHSDATVAAARVTPAPSSPAPSSAVQSLTARIER